MMITTVTHNRMPVFGEQPHAREAIECLYRVQKLHPFFLYGFVIMPDHCHFLLNVPSPNTVSRVMNSYKSGLTFDLGLPKLWQRRFYITLIKNPERALVYIHMNPVAAGFVDTPNAFPWPSASGMWDVHPL